MLQHELVRVATTDREAAVKPRSVTLRRGEGSADQEKQRSAQLVSAGPQAALLAPLVQGAEFEPWTCVGLESRLLLHGEGVLGIGSQGPVAGLCHRGDGRGQAAQQPGGQGLARTLRALQSGRRPGEHCSLRTALTGVLGVPAPLQPRPQASPEETPHRGRGLLPPAQVWVSFHEGQL